MNIKDFRLLQFEKLKKADILNEIIVNHFNGIKNANELLRITNGYLRLKNKLKLILILSEKYDFKVKLDIDSFKHNIHLINQKEITNLLSKLKNIPKKSPKIKVPKKEEKKIVQPQTHKKRILKSDPRADYIKSNSLTTKNSVFVIYSGLPGTGKKA